SRCPGGTLPVPRHPRRPDSLGPTSSERVPCSGFIFVGGSSRSDDLRPTANSTGSINVASSASAFELLTRFDTVQHCSLGAFSFYDWPSFSARAGIIIAKPSREDFGHAHASRRATLLGLWTRTMGLLLRWPLAKTKPP